jgi:hypothetical protein
MYPVDPKLASIHQSILSSKRLEKLAHIYAGDTEVLEKIAAVKVRVDNEIFEMAKESGIARKSWDTAKQYLKGGGAGKTAIKGLVGGGAAGVGLGVPAYMLGSGLLRRGREETEATTADIRNKVLQTALGVGGIGAGMYGLSKLMGGKSKPNGATPEGNQSGGLMGLLPKFGSDEKAVVEEALEKLATVGTIEGMLDLLPDTLDDETQKLASEIRVLNHSYGVHLLHGLYPDDV